MSLRDSRWISPVLVALLLACSVHVRHARAEIRSLTPEIVNGVPTPAFPEVVRVLVTDTGGEFKGTCSGTYIGCGLVLTAAHCLCGDDPELDRGALCTDGFASGQAMPLAIFSASHGFVQPESWSVHPDYSFGERSDLALVRTAEIPIVPADLADRSPPPGTDGRIVGYGNEVDGEGGGLKRSGRMTTSECGPFGAPGAHLCQLFTEPLGPPGEDSNICQGDSGGPLFTGTGLAGLTSGNFNLGKDTVCIPDAASFYADVDFDRGWLIATGGSLIGRSSCTRLPDVGTPDVEVLSGEGRFSSAEPQAGFTFPVPARARRLVVSMNSENEGLGELRLAAGGPPGPGVSPCDRVTTRSFRSRESACIVEDPAPGDWFLRVDRLNGAAEFQTTATLYLGDDEQPDEEPDTSDCVPSDEILCLNEDRFEVEVTFETSEESGVARGTRLTEETAYFSFFSPDNVEVVVKVLDACGPPFDRFWVFAAGLTDQGVVIRVRDTETGEVNRYAKERGPPFELVRDTDAFASCP